MIRLPDRSRRCREIVARIQQLDPRHGHLGYRLHCNRRIGWWASWFTNRCRQHRKGAR